MLISVATERCEMHVIDVKGTDDEKKARYAAYCFVYYGGVTKPEATEFPPDDETLAHYTAVVQVATVDVTGILD